VSVDQTWLNGRSRSTGLSVDSGVLVGGPALIALISDPPLSEKPIPVACSHALSRS